MWLGFRNGLKLKDKMVFFGFTCVSQLYLLKIGKWELLYPVKSNQRNLWKEYGKKLFLLHRTLYILDTEV